MYVNDYTPKGYSLVKGRPAVHGPRVGFVAGAGREAAEMSLPSVRSARQPDHCRLRGNIRCHPRWVAGHADLVRRGASAEQNPCPSSVCRRERT